MLSNPVIKILQVPYIPTDPSTFPILLKLVQISMIIVVSTDHCERSFSALKRIKTYLRASMGEERLQNLSILAIRRRSLLVNCLLMQLLTSLHLKIKTEEFF